MQKCMKENPGLARRFINVFRYIDDLIAINDGGFFNRVFKDIYPPELVLEKENDADDSATHLDLEITIVEGELYIGYMTNEMILPFL